MIRAIQDGDIPSICEIYNYYIENTIISFEERPVSYEDMKHRVDDVSSSDYPWLVYCEQDQVLGYAYAGIWKNRSAYQYSVETSVYVRQGHHRKGIGKRLYRDLLERLKQKGVHVVIAGAAMPNESSTRLHESFGFKQAAHFKEVGFKFGKWVDVVYWQLALPRTNGSNDKSLLRM